MSTTPQYKVQTVSRPYTLIFHATGSMYPLSSEDAQRLIDEYPIVGKPTRNKVLLRGDDGHYTSIQAATLGGGPAFIVERAR